jgi:imidazolonepropionase-like amidohydrolase
MYKHVMIPTDGSELSAKAVEAGLQLAARLSAQVTAMTVSYHCEHADEEALDMLEAVKDRVFVGPAIGLLHAAVYEAPEGALPTGVRQGIELGLAAAARAYPEMKKRGIRVVIGGDYGFARTPQGENARDIAHFVRHLGYSPSEALVCATRYGAELMGMGHEAGQVREGFLADLLLVDGDPVADVSVLQSKDRLVAILKGGELYKFDRRSLERQQMRAAE